jgi:replicative DNA helicase
MFAGAGATRLSTNRPHASSAARRSSKYANRFADAASTKPATGTPTQDVQEQLEEAERRLCDISSGSRHTAAKPASAVVDAVVTQFTLIMTGQAEPHLLRTPFRDLNAQLDGGFRPGNLVVAAGRPGMGKTTLATCMARLMAQSGTGVRFQSLEMPDIEIGTKLLADQGATWPTTRAGFREGGRPR